VLATVRISYVCRIRLRVRDNEPAAGHQSSAQLREMRTACS